MRIALIAAACCLVSTAAAAQFITMGQQQQTSPFAEPIIRVTTNFRTLATPGATLGQGQAPVLPDRQGEESIRKELYQLAANECAVLSGIYKAECRLGSVSISQPTGNVWPPGSMTATAVYELRVTTK